MEYLGRLGVRGFVRTCQSVAGAAGAGACAITGFMGAAVNALQARLEQGPVAEPDDVDESQDPLDQQLLIARLLAPHQMQI